MSKALSVFVLAIGPLVSVPQGALATVPFTEQFSSDNSNWYTDAVGANPAAYQASGGPGLSSFVSTTASMFGLPDAAPIILFQARDEFNSSNHAFEGNWIGSGINQFSTYVRHNAPDPLVFFARFTRPTGGAGIAAEKAAPVLSNTWTRLSFDLSASNINNPTNNPSGELFVEGPPSLFNSVFSNVGHIQIGFSVPAGAGMNDNFYVFGLDRPSIAAVPEPASGVLAIVVTFGGGLAWRRARGR